MTNTGTITGGKGGDSDFNEPGDGSAGVDFSGAAGTLINVGLISGGASGLGRNQVMAGTGAGVIFRDAAGVLVNGQGGSINDGVSMGDYANSVTLHGGSVINAGLNVGTNIGSLLTLTGVGTQVYSGAVDATTFYGTLIKTGSGTWVLDQPMNHVGGTQVNAGTLSVAHPNALGSGTGQRGRRRDADGQPPYRPRCADVNAGGLVTLGGGGTLTANAGLINHGVIR